MADLADMLDRRAGLALFASLGIAAAILAACAKDEPGASAGIEAGAGDSESADRALLEDGAVVPGTDSGDAGVKPTDAAIVNGPGEAGAECSFNRECNAALRCECDESTGCACKAGVRGTGQNGIDACDSGNGCASAVCVEGPADAGYFCSDECATSANCTGKLPLCSTIAFVGRICIRQN